MKRWVSWVVVFGVVMGSVLAQAEANTYTDANGLYSVPIPTQWTAETRASYAVLSSPDGGVVTYVLVVAERDLEAALRAAWERVDPDFPAGEYTARQVQRITDAALLEGFDEAVVITYNTGLGEGQRVTQGVALALDNFAYVLIFDGTLSAIQQRNAQIQQIFTGFKPTALVQVDLTTTQPQVWDDAMSDALRVFVARLRAELGEQGVAVVIVQNGQVVFSEAFGARNPQGDPLTLDTRMMIGSITKTMTTLVMARLVDAGLLDWEAPARTYLPQFAVKDPALSKRITVENLVCACTGVPRRDLELLLNADHLTAQDIVTSLQTFEFFTDFGEAFQYSNQLVATAGYLAAVAQGGTFASMAEDYIAMMETRLFAPLGMTRTTFKWADALADPNYATPYGLQVDMRYVPLDVRIERILDSVMPAGSLWSTPNDMTTYLQTMLARGVAPDGTRLVSAENLDRLWRAQVPINATADYALGWILEKFKGVAVVGHSGNTLGFSSDMAMLPDANIGMLVMTNQQGSAIPSLVRFFVLEQLYKLPDTATPTLNFQLQVLREQLAARKPYLQERPDDALIADYLGTFRNDALGTLVLRATADGCEADVGEFTVAIWQRNPAPDDERQEPRLLMATPPLAGTDIILGKDENGKPQLTIGAGVLEYVFTRED